VIPARARASALISRAWSCGVRNLVLVSPRFAVIRDHPRGIDHPPRRLAPPFTDERELYRALPSAAGARERVLRVDASPVVHALSTRGWDSSHRGELERRVVSLSRSCVSDCWYVLWFFGVGCLLFLCVVDFS